jgi:NTE family protein
MQYDLVFKGGGAKGNAFAGALEVFSKAGHTWRRLVGTSAGAITATLVGAGYKHDELLDACSEKLPGTDDPVFTTFMDTPEASDFTAEICQQSDTMRLLNLARLGNGAILGKLKGEMLEGLLKIDLYRELFSFNECGGFYAGNAFLKWFRSKLEGKGLAADVTWKDFAAQTGADVTVVTSDVTEKEELVLNARTAPDTPVALSVRMSMSIPFVWREMVWDAAWGQYRGRDKAGHILVDGGVLSNFPLQLITATDDETKAMMGDVDAAGAAPLGLYLDATVPVAGAAKSDTRRPRLRVADRVTRLMDTMTDSRDQAVMSAHSASVCRIPCGGYGTTEFRMSADRQALLIESGRAAMKAYLKI